MKLRRIFGTTDEVREEKVVETPQLTVPEVPETLDLMQRAAQAYEAALRAQREGDWSRYGEEIKKLGDILRQ